MNSWKYTKPPPAQHLKVLHTLFHDTEYVLRTWEEGYAPRKNPILSKNLGLGDLTWSTFKTVLGWVIDMVNFNM